MWCFSIYDAPVEIVIGTVFLYSLIGYSALIGLSVAILFVPLNNWTSKGFMQTQDKMVRPRSLIFPLSSFPTSLLPSFPHPILIPLTIRWPPATAASPS